MKVYYEFDSERFEPWPEVTEAYDIIRFTGNLKKLEAIIEEDYLDDMSEDELNEILWANRDHLLEWVGLEETEEV